MTGVKVKTWNQAVGALGVPGTGKSTYALERVREQRKQVACYVVAHDPQGSYEGPDIARHASRESAAQGLSTRPDLIHCLDVSDGTQAIELAQTVGKASMARAQNGQVFPVICLLDEIVLVGDADPRRLGDILKEAITQRRHHGVGFVWTTQHPGFVHYSLLALSTELVCFRMCDEDSLRKFKRIGMPEDLRVQIPELPDYEYVVYEPGKRRSDAQAGDPNGAQGKREEAGRAEKQLSLPGSDSRPSSGPIRATGHGTTTGPGERGRGDAPGASTQGQSTRGSS